jgi:regulatory protein
VTSDSHADPLVLAARALQHRDRSRHDVDDRLARAGVDEGARAEALEALERLGYLDDDRFARSRAVGLAERGYGDDAIRADLAKQGVCEPKATETILALEPEAVRARRAVDELGRSARTAGRLIRKGFAPDVVEEALDLDLGADDGSVV